MSSTKEIPYPENWTIPVDLETVDVPLFKFLAEKRHIMTTYQVKEEFGRDDFFREVVWHLGRKYGFIPMMSNCRNQWEDAYHNIQYNNVFLERPGKKETA